ncbi:MAG: gamma-glutamyltransferase [Pseudomonadota bacterium]
MARPEPEIGTGISSKNAVSAQNHMVVSSHPEATRAGEAVLAAGGTAADAAIAVQMMLGLVEPQSSGIGGGAFILYYDAKKGQLVSLDGRETAPVTAGKHLFTGQDGNPMAFMDAVVGGRAVGTPGTLRVLEKLHSWYGQKEWGSLFGYPIKVAENGFTVTPRLSKMVEADRKYLGTYTDTKLYFYPDALNPVQVGTTLRNPDYAVTLRAIAQNGADAFYTGEIAQEIVRTVREVARDNPGLLSMEDLANYEAKERKPVCGNYRKYAVCSMGEPSSGGLTLLSILGMLEYHNLRALGSNNPTSWHLIGEASRLAFADRNYYMADADFVRTPGERLINRDYLKQRAILISPNIVQSDVSHGVPPGWNDVEPLGPDVYIRRPGTSHMSIVDSYGNMLSMTTTIEGAFGSKLMTQGFLLNNELTDFSFAHEKDGKAVANRVEGGKRPRSSMAPTIVFDPNNNPFLIIGSAGGSRIIGFVAQRIVAMIDWQMDVQDALNMPNIVNRGNAMEVENGAESIARGLEKMGHTVKMDEMTSGLTAIHFKNGQMYGAADPRREGLAAGL